MAGKDEPRQVKLVVVGDGGVGKTCLLICYCKGDYPKEYVPTVFDNYVVSLTAGGELVELSLYDTAGQEEYDRLRPLSYANADVLLICFSVMSSTSLENVKTKWVKEVKHYRPNSPILLIGTKKDLRGNKQELEKMKEEKEEPVSTEMARKVQGQIGAVAYLECSAYTRENLKEVFDEALKAVLLAPTVEHKKDKRCILL